MLRSLVLSKLVPGLAGVLPMENVIRSRPQRSLVRRLAAPLSVASALLAGGGWGVHQYTSGNVADSQSLESTIAAHSAPSAKDELKMLFASEPAKPQAVPKPFATQKNKAPIKKDRYAMPASVTSELPMATPELPPLVEAKPVARPAKPQAVIGDRYAAVMTLPVATKEATKEKVAEPTLATVEPDVARGQDPSGNPLRSSRTSATTNSPDIDARNAFGSALAQTPNTAQRSASQLQPSGPSNALTAALQKARPLQQSPPAALRNGRYDPTRATPPPIASQRPRQHPKQRPAPPLEIQSPPTPYSPAPYSPAPYSTAAAEQSQKRAGLGNPPASITPTPGLANHPGTGRPGERLLEGAQSPAITLQKLAPEEIQVGKRCTFAIRVQNTGQRTTQNVQIRDEVPMGTELMGTAPRATVSGSTIIWDLGTLSPGEERTVEMEVLPTEEGELGSVATVSFSAQASAKSRCTRPELALRLSSKPQVHVGQQHMVQIEVTNPGSGDATGVMLLESIPAGVSHEAGPALEFEIGTLRAGETRRMELLLTAEQAGKVNNVMTARADASLQVEASCEFEVIAPELRLSVEGPKRRFLERPATYRVSVDNPGTASAKEVQLITHLPRGMQFVSANNMGEYDSASHSVHWSLAELPASERGTVELVALPIEAGEQTLQVAAKARQGLEDRTDKRVMVEGLSALMFEVVDVEGLIEIGGETTYEIRVSNQGSKAATNVQVVAIMPAGIRPMSGQGETRHQIQGDRVVFAPLPQLAPKSETTLRIQAQGVRPGDQRVRVQITADDMQQPITKEISTRVYADE